MPRHRSSNKSPKTSQYRPSPIRELIIQFLRSIFIVFSSDIPPSEDFIEEYCPMLKKYRRSIAFFGEWNSKGRELLVHLEAFGLKAETLSPIEYRFFYTILPTLPNTYSGRVEYEYNKMKKEHTEYPPFKEFCSYLLPTPVGNSDSNVEVHLRRKFEEPAVSVESCFPGTREMGVSPKEFSKQIAKLSAEQKAEIAKLGLEDFMVRNLHLRVIRPTCERSVWPAPPTPWGLGNKAKTVLYLNIQLSQMVHSPIEVCRSCHATSSDMPEFVRNLGDLGPNLLSYPRGKKNEEKYLRFSCSFCHEWISWMSISTKCRQLRSQFPKLHHHLIEDMLSLMVQMFDASVKAAIMTQFPPKECYACNDLTPYDDQKHDECINTHSSCICMGSDCEGMRRKHRDLETQTGKVERHLHSCIFAMNRMTLL